MASLVPLITKGSFQNWLKCALGVLFAKEGLTDFVSTELTQFQTDLLQYIWNSTGIPAGTTCNSCTTASLQRGQLCPNGICDALMKAIRQEHQFNNPSWKNTDARGWCTDAFELSKCFMPPDGYLGTRTFADTDFNGTLSVIINNKRFQSKFVAKLNTTPMAICKKARDIGRAIRHSPDLLLADADLAQYLQDLIILLSDPKFLASDSKAQAAVIKLNQLQTNTLTIHANDITQIIHDNIGRSISRQHLAVLQDINSHLCTVKTASVTAIDTIVKVKLTAMDEMKIKSEQIKLEMEVHMNQKKQDIDKHIDTKKQDIDKHADQKKKDIDKHIDTKKRDIDKHTDKKKQDIDKHIDTKKQDFDIHADQKKKDIDSHVEQKMQYLDEYIDHKKKGFPQTTDPGRTQSFHIQETEFAVFQTELIEFYRKEHSMTSVSPLVEEHEVSLVDFYVKPQMVAVDLQHAFGNPTKTPVLSYEQLFCQEMENVYTNIYVTSSAGMGKTSFCKHICMTWCQAHNHVKTMDDKFKPEDIRAMVGFKFLFYITLRDVNRSKCHLDDLIEFSVKEILRKQPVYLLHQILDDKPCLVVVDGLDEWIHPDKCDRRKNDHGIPHRKFRNNWTIITTTRSWKFDILQLTLNHIDNHIELNELNKRSSKQLVKNAISVLNKKFKTEKTVEEFYRTTSQLKLGDIRKVPYLHLHCVCLWYDGRNIGNSKCEIYSNILDLTLHRGTQKLQHESSFLDPIQQERSVTIPTCMVGKEYCVQHQSLLLKIGELAFYALFCSENRQMLVVDYKFATNYLKPDELNYCLKLGLLSQNKVYGSVSRRISNISFQHKTIQEYLAAFYMQSSILNPSAASHNIHQLAVQTCATLSRILEMSEVFIFLSGFSSEAYKDISWQLINTVNEDENTRIYRSRLSIDFSKDEYNVMLKYQTLLVDCVEEMELNRQAFYPLPLQDIIINEQSKQAESYIQKLIQGNSGGIKSLHVRDCENTENATDFLNRLDPQYFDSLEKLDLKVVARQPDIEGLLQQSRKTLQCLVIHNVSYKQSRYINESTVFSQICSDTVLSMSLLKSLSLIHLIVTHNQLETVTAFLISRVTIIQIHISNVTCSDHDESCPGVQFHLSRHDNLQLLGLVNVPVSQLQLNIQHLEECWIGGLPHRVITSCFTSLPAAHNLHTLVCSHFTYSDITTLITTLPALLQLEELYIQCTYITDKKLDLNTDMTNLKYIALLEVTMTSSSFRAFVDTISLLSQSVTIHLRNSTVTTDVEYQTVKENIRHSGTFIVIFDGMHRIFGNNFKFKTIK